MILLQEIEQERSYHATKKIRRLDQILQMQ